MAGKGYPTQAYPTQSPYPTQAYQAAPAPPQMMGYYVPQPQAYAQPSAPPSYSAATAPPPPYAPEGMAPTPQAYAGAGPMPAPGYAPGPATYYQQPQHAMHMGAIFDAGCRFDGNSPPSIPPPPPGVIPNAAQMAASQGQSVSGTQRSAGFFSGGTGGGYTFW